MSATGTQKGAIGRPVQAKKDRLLGIQADLAYRSPGSLLDEEAAAALPRLTLKSSTETAPLLSLQSQPLAEATGKESGFRHGIGLRLLVGKVDEALVRGGEVAYQPRFVWKQVGIHAGIWSGAIAVDQLKSGSAGVSLGATIGRGGFVAGVEGGLGKWLGLNQKYGRGGGLVGYEVGPSSVLLAVDRYTSTQNSDSESQLGSFITAGLSLRREL